MTNKEKEVAVNLLYNIKWFQQAIPMLAKLAELDQKSLDNILKLAKPEITSAQMDEEFIKTFVPSTADVPVPTENVAQPEPEVVAE